MATSVIDHFRRAVLLRDGAGLGDGELLGCFIERHDEAALAALVKRHGPMVWGVCRRLLSHHDAEDAFQATFIVLVRKAASIVPRAMVGNWLYGVAHQTALQARRTAKRRRAREVQVTEMPAAATVQPDQWPDVRRLLDQELSRLPDNYRAVIVLCDLEGRTRKEVARQLGVPEGTVAGRLPRARAMLAKRLTQRGVTLSGGVLAAVLAQQAAMAAVPNSVVDSTIIAASLLAAGKSAATGAISVKVAVLTEGVLKAMLFSKLRAGIAVVLILGFVATGTTILTRGTATAPGATPARPVAAVQDTKSILEDDKKAAAEKPGEPAANQEKKAFTAWGKEFGGLQAGLGRRQKLADNQGEAVTLVVRIRNVGKEPVKSQYDWSFFTENHPAITDVEGKRVVGKHSYFGGVFNVPVELKLAPGEEKDLYHLNLELKPGKFQVQLERVFADSPHAKLHPELLKLATGKLELEIKTEQKRKAPPKDLSKIPPPGGVPLFLGRPGEPIRVDGIEKARTRLEAVPAADLEKWVVELERIIDKKLKDGLPSARQVCRTDFVVRLSVAFDDLKWNAKTADELLQRAQTMPASEAKVWKEAFEVLLKKEIGQTDTTLLAGGPEWAVPLVLIPVDAFHVGQKYSVVRSKRYLARLKQLAADDVLLWYDADEFGGTRLDAAVNIILLDDFFEQDKFRRDKFAAAMGARKK